MQRPKPSSYPLGTNGMHLDLPGGFCQMQLGKYRAELKFYKAGDLDFYPFASEEENYAKEQQIVVDKIYRHYFSKTDKLIDALKKEHESFESVNFSLLSSITVRGLQTKFEARKNKNYEYGKNYYMLSHVIEDAREHSYFSDVTQKTLEELESNDTVIDQLCSSFSFYGYAFDSYKVKYEELLYKLG